ncbi:MAG: transketolase C-terminal domain-containing protein [Pseudomonadota bacterium]
MRNKFADTLYKCAVEDSDIAIVVADISPAGSMENFRQEFPHRFLNVGVAEQSMIGICAGMSLRGLQPFAYTIATFTLYRPFEFVRDDLCYQNLPVTIVGVGGGVVYSTLGGTHHCQEDVAIASAIPNMSVIAPCDPEEAEAATKYCAVQKNGPIYLRLGKAGEPTLTANADTPWEFGKIRYLQKGNDVCILSYGIIMKKSLEVAQTLEKLGKSVSLVSVHTVKPLDIPGIETALSAHSEVVVIEEHAPSGGLSHRVKEVAWNMQASCKLHTFTLQDRFLHNYGDHDDLLAAHGLSVDKIVAGIK